MAQIIEITDFTREELSPYVRLTEARSGTPPPAKPTGCGASTFKTRRRNSAPGSSWTIGKPRR